MRVENQMKTFQTWRLPTTSSHDTMPRATSTITPRMAAAVGSVKRLPKIQSPTTRRMPASMVRSTSDIGPMARSSCAAQAGASGDRFSPGG